MNKTNESFVNNVVVNDIGDELRKKLMDYILGHLWKGNITDEKADELSYLVGDLMFDMNTYKVYEDTDAIDDLAHELFTTPQILAKKLSPIIEKYNHLFKYTVQESHSDEVDVKVTFEDGSDMIQKMATHLTEDEIKDYFKPGSITKVGDDMKKIVDVEIMNDDINESNINGVDLEDRKDSIKSDLFFVSNIHKHNDSDVILSIELKPYDHKVINKIFIFSNSVIFYNKHSKTVVDEIKNTKTSSNEELVETIESRLKSIKESKVNENVRQNTKEEAKEFNMVVTDEEYDGQDIQRFVMLDAKDKNFGTWEKAMEWLENEWKKDGYLYHFFKSNLGTLDIVAIGDHEFVGIDVQDAIRNLDEDELIYESNHMPLRSVKVKFDKGGEITTSMAAHLTDEDIYNYYKIGSYFNLGTIDDDMQKVVDVEILDNENREDVVTDDIQENSKILRFDSFSINESEYFTSQERVKGGSTHVDADGGVPHDRMYNFLKDDLEKLEQAINTGDNEETERFFSYWNQHLKSLKMDMEIQENSKVLRFDSFSININERQDFNEDEFKTHGSYTISNTGGYEIMISDAGDAAKVRDAYGSDNPKTSDWLEIEYIDGEPVIDPDGYDIPLSQVMKVNENENFTSQERPIRQIEKEVFEYLNELRDSGVTNMYGAVPYIMERFPKLQKFQASALLSSWMKNFREDGNYETIKESNESNHDFYEMSVVVDIDDADAFRDFLKSKGFKWDEYNETERYSNVHFEFTNPQMKLIEKDMPSYVLEVVELNDTDIYENWKNDRAEVEMKKSGEEIMKNASLKTCYVPNTSWFDKPPYYNTDEIKSVIKGMVSNIRFIQEHGMSNQPEVVVFDCSNPQEVEDKLNNYYGTEWVKVETCDEDWCMKQTNENENKKIKENNMNNKFKVERFNSFKTNENVDAYEGTDDEYLLSPEYFVETYYNGQFSQLRTMYKEMLEKDKKEELISYLKEMGETGIITWIVENF